MAEALLERSGIRDRLGAVRTPAYVYDLAVVRENHAHLRSALPDSAEVYYSLKANPHPALLGELRAGGALPEVCSPGELDAALQAGWSAGQVLYTGPGKRDADLDRAVRLGVREFSVDSVVALDQLEAVAAAHGVRLGCLLRINDDRPAAGQGLAMTGVASQFGADLGWVLAEPERFTGRAHVRMRGLHLYMGTNLVTVEDLVAQFRQSVRTAVGLCEVFAAHGEAIELLDLGGGFGAPFAKRGDRIPLDGLKTALEDLFREELPDPAPAIAFETGRYLVGTAGTLVTSVLDVKRSHDRDVVVLESGINHLGGMAGLRRVPPLVPDLVGEPDGRGRMTAMITGPLCTPLDLWARSAELPEVRPGDVLAVPNVGAYGLCASLLAFLGHPMPAEVVVDGDDPQRSPQVSRLELIRIHGED
ncbi:type III PLP-dependent enzyme [Saccharopolyspora indica]|uniref:type III PLP-dependent enzyme n=1 Tax=Saccharopolyspora indica TaxID=1229659 RepID=UPI0022EAB91E|nr:type III PLP-dependent enzyme [Saccharopolyspora indica]MDA3647095.1 type III PLP-dependent enzyme [Saccharopolyspora indica]